MKPKAHLFFSELITALKLKSQVLAHELSTKLYGDITTRFVITDLLHVGYTTYTAPLSMLQSLLRVAGGRVRGRSGVWQQGLAGSLSVLWQQQGSSVKHLCYP